jgi:hypothetical protein
MDFSNLNFGLAFSLLMKTTPLLLVRLGAMLAFWAVAIIYLLIVLAVGTMIAAANETIGWIVGLVALLAVIPAYNLAYRYVFYMLKAAHIAIMSEILVNGKLPDGINQLNYGKQKVTERFGEVNAMFLVDELVSGVVGAFTGTVSSVLSWLPGDFGWAIAILNRVIHYATNYIDEAVMARSFYNSAKQDVWVNARDGVVLYAMSWKPLLTSAVALMIVSFIPGIVAFVIFAAPIGGLIYFINPAIAGWTIIFALFLGWVFKVALGDSFALAAIIAAYQRITDGKTPDPAMAAQLDSISDAFKDLKNKAMQGFTPQAPATAEPKAS